MPRLSKSDRAKARIILLVKQLIACANHELASDQIPEPPTVRWIDPQSKQPKLVVQTTLKGLASLISLASSERIDKDQIRQDLQLLKTFLQILEDNRTRTQGAEIWHFTLKLWHTSIAQNLTELERCWDQCKSQKSNYSPGVEQELSQPKLFPTSESIAPASELPQLRYNLPARDYTQFIGREAQIKQILDLLNPNHPATRIGIAGIGGVGKTSLVLEVAYRCLALEHSGSRSNLAPDLTYFDTIVFTSAKSHRLTSRGILPHLQPERSLRQLCHAILQTLGDSESLNADLAAQIRRIQCSLARQSVLLIVDNLETIEEEQVVLAFLYALPATVKVIITSCERIVMDTFIHLEPLPETEGLQFIQHQAQNKDVSLSLEEVSTLYQATGGIPAAIVYAVGQLASGYLLAEVIPRLTLAQGDFCRFYFERSVKPLRDQPAHRLLMGLALFPKLATREALIQVAIPDTEVTDGLARLCQLSLIERQADHYTMLPLTREYALAELQAHPNFEQEARNRWVNWYLTFCQQHGNQNWKEWHEYAAIDREWENIQAVIEWCIEQERYEDFSLLWQYVKGYTHIYGYSHNRLRWMQWWIEAAQQRSDRVTLAQALRDHAWTLTLMSRPDYLAEAKQLLQQAWELRESASSQLQLELTLEQAILCIHQTQFESAQEWLQHSKQLLPQVPLNPSDYLRHAVRIDYYEAEIWCRQGDYEQAKILFHRVLEGAQTLDWQQIEIYTLNWLAEIALEQTELDQAEALLSRGLPIAQQQQDKRSIAFHIRSRAYLEQLKGNKLVARQWAEAAIGSFAGLGMESEAQEMRDWLAQACR